MSSPPIAVKYQECVGGGKAIVSVSPTVSRARLAMLLVEYSCVFSELSTMTTFAQLHDCDSCNDESCIVEKRKNLALFCVASIQ